MKFHKYLRKDWLESPRLSNRDGFGKGLAEAGVKNLNIFAVCADLEESIKFDYFKDQVPSRFIQVGVAEQNMIGVAAGLALSGKNVFAGSYAVFNPGRNWDQIRTSVCYSEANVKVVGTHAGLNVGEDGATHQALEDIAITRCLPNIKVFSPADYQEAYSLALKMSEYTGPAYIRLGRANFPQIFTAQYEFNIGQNIVLKEGKDIAIFATGRMVYEALLASVELEKQNISAYVVNISTIKNLDEKNILNLAKKCRAFISIEEHQEAGGMGSAIAELLIQNHPIPLKILAVKDKFGQSGKMEQLFNHYNLTSHDIINLAISLSK